MIKLKSACAKVAWWGGLGFTLLLGACSSTQVPGAQQQFIPSAEQYEQLFPNRLPFYDHSGLVAALKLFPTMAATGTETQRRQEMDKESS